MWTNMFLEIYGNINAVNKSVLVHCTHSYKAFLDTAMRVIEKLEENKYGMF